MLKVKIFDEEHELDLENDINNFIKNIKNLVDIKYQTSHFFDNNEQIFSFSALVLYEIED